jgi:dTDP-4-dehydrorhamnose 3,5-epimerase
MDKITIDGVNLTTLEIITNKQGSIFHGLKKSDSDFKRFGEAYFSTVEKNFIKGWNKHKKMTVNLLVCFGKVKFVVYDDRDDSKSKGSFFSCILSPTSYMRLKISEGLWFAFKGISDYNMILNIASLEHNPKELERLPIQSIKYNW